MVFSSIVFLCIFLPAVIVLYYLCPVKLRNFFLLAASLFFYAWGEPKYIVVMLFSTIFDYCNGRFLAFFKQHGKMTLCRLVLAVSIAGNLGILCFFKYTDFILSIADSLTADHISPIGLALPIGISFYTFQTMSYTIDVYRGCIQAQRSLISFSMYVCLFPQLIAGPIVRYSDIKDEIPQRRTSPALCAAGMKLFLTGLGKKVLLANQIGALWSEISSLSISDQSAALAWLGALSYTFQIYFDFSGYSDMAAGLGRMFGFHFPKNFHYPYESKSITEFWRRWHITLSSWFREYLYIPLGGSRRGMGRQIFNLLIVWFLTGLWHGAGWNFILWGLYFFLLLVFEKLFLLNLLNRLPSFLQHMYALFFIILGWVIFACSDLHQLKQYLKMLAGIGIPLVNTLALYKWTSYAFFLIMLAAASTGFLKNKISGILNRFSHPFAKTAVFWAEGCWCLSVLMLSMSMLVSGSYNPFLYFRF